MENHKFHTTKEHIRLSRLEKSQMKASITMAGSQKRGTRHARYWAHHFFRSGVVVALLLVVTVGSVSAAAEQTIPGDYLYPVKTRVNEKVTEAFSLSTESKIKHATKLVDRRLEEAEKVVKKERLSETDQDEVITSLVEQTTLLRKKASGHIQKLEDSGEEGKALTLSSELGTTLSTHVEILEEVDEDGDDSETLYVLRGKLIAEEESVRDEAEQIIKDFTEEGIEDSDKEIQVLIESIEKEQREYAEKTKNRKYESDILDRSQKLHLQSVEMKGKADEYKNLGDIQTAIPLYAEALDYMNEGNSILSK